MRNLRGDLKLLLGNQANSTTKDEAYFTFHKSAMSYLLETGAIEERIFPLAISKFSQKCFQPASAVLKLVHFTAISGEICNFYWDKRWLELQRTKLNEFAKARKMRKLRVRSAWKCLGWVGFRAKKFGPKIFFINFSLNFLTDGVCGGTLERAGCQSASIHCEKFELSFLTNISYYFDKYILQYGQIHLTTLERAGCQSA